MMYRIQTLISLLQRNVFQKDDIEKKKIQGKDGFKIVDGRFFYPLQYLFRYLSIKDLFYLACSSRYLLRCVEEHCKLLCQPLDFRRELDLLLCSQFLLQKDHIRQNKLADDKTSYIKRFAIYAYLKRLRRISVADCRLSSLTIIQFCDHLNRRIVHFTDSWLFGVSHVFQDVRPGIYKAIIRMRVYQGPWPNAVCGMGNGTKLYVQWIDSKGRHEVKTMLDYIKYDKLKRNIRLRSGRPIKLDGATFENFDRKEHWFDFCLEEFTVNSLSDLIFGLSYIDSSCKTKMSWDYIELRPIQM